MGQHDASKTYWQSSRYAETLQVVISKHGSQITIAISMTQHQNCTQRKFNNRTYQSDIQVHKEQSFCRLCKLYCDRKAAKSLLAAQKSNMHEPKPTYIYMMHAQSCSQACDTINVKFSHSIAMVKKT